MNFIISNYNQKLPVEEHIKPLESFKPLGNETPPEDVKIISMNSKYIYDDEYKGDIRLGSRIGYGIRQ